MSSSSVPAVPACTPPLPRRAPAPQVLLADRSLIGRGGATVMAQMTVAVAVGEEEPDHWEHHLADTLKAGRGLCDPALSQLLCEQGPACIREMDEWGIGWARRDGHLAQVHAPGHDRKRCVYVDFLNTGPAVSKTLRAVVQRIPEVQRVGDLLITELAIRDGVCIGAHATHVVRPAPRYRSPRRRRSSPPAD